MRRAGSRNDSVICTGPWCPPSKAIRQPSCTSGTTSAPTSAIWLGKLAATARLGRLAVNGRSGLQGAHGALARCQECYGTLWLRYCADGLSPGGRRGLDSLRRRGDPLTDWAKGVADANDRCLEPLHEVGLALGRTWQELVERAWLGLIVQSPGVIESGAEVVPEPVPPAVSRESCSPGPEENEGAGA